MRRASVIRIITGRLAIACSPLRIHFCSFFSDLPGSLNFSQPWWSAFEMPRTFRAIRWQSRRTTATNILVISPTRPRPQHDYPITGEAKESRSDQRRANFIRSHSTVGMCHHRQHQREEQTDNTHAQWLSEDVSASATGKYHFPCHDSLRGF